MDKLNYPNGNPGFSAKTQQINDDFFLQSPNTTSIDFVPLTGLDPLSRDILMDGYDSDEGTRLNAVLADVRKKIDEIDGLHVEDFVEASLTSANLIATGKQQVEPPKSVDELILELCGGAGLKEANAIGGYASTDTDHGQGNGDISKRLDNTARNKVTRKNQITETTLTSEALAIADRRTQTAELSNFCVNENNIKLNLLNKQALSFENLQAPPSLETISVNQAKTALIKENGNKGAATDQNDNLYLKPQVKETFVTGEARLKVFKTIKSEISEKVPTSSEQQQHMEKPKPSMQQLQQSRKEKKKLTVGLSFPDKSSTIRQVIITGKRKISGSKEPNETKTLANVDANCSCFQVHENNVSSRLRNNSVYQIQSPREVPDEKLMSKADKSVGGTLKKNFWTIEKKLGLGFLRSPSIEERNIPEKHEPDTTAKVSANENKTTLLNFEESHPIIESEPNQEEQKRRSKSAVKDGKSASVCLDDDISYEANPKKRTSASPRLIRKFRITFPHPPPVKLPTPDENKKTFPRVDSEPKLLHSRLNEFDAFGEAVKQRRATMDSATARSKFLDTFVNRKKSLKDEHDPNHSSLPLKLHLAINQFPEPLASRFAASLDSDGSLQGSKDSLEDDDGFPKSGGSSRQGRMKVTSNMDEHQAEFLRRMASNKTKKNILRKSMRYVGKSTSIPAYECEDMAERTWLPEVSACKLKIRVKSEVGDSQKQSVHPEAFCLTLIKGNRQNEQKSRADAYIAIRIIERIAEI